EHVLDDALRDVDEAVQIRGRERAKVFCRVVREGLREEDSRVVHEHIDGAEPPHCGIDELLGGSRQSDIAIDEREVIRTLQRVLLTDVARVGHYVVPALEEQVGHCGTDSLRRARHDGGLAFCSHVKLSWRTVSGAYCRGSTCGLIHQGSQRLARARIDSVLERRPEGGKLLFTLVGSQPSGAGMTLIDDQAPGLDRCKKRARYPALQRGPDLVLLPAS